MKTQITNGHDIIGEIIKEMHLNLKFWKDVKETPALQVNNAEIFTHKRYLEFSWIAIRRIFEQELLPISDIAKFFNYVELDSVLMNVMETYTHERKDFISKDIVRQRRRRFMILEQKIKQIQDAGNMSQITYIQLKDETNEEFSQEVFKPNLNLTPDHLSYYKYVSEFLYLQAMVKCLILMDKYAITKEDGQSHHYNKSQNLLDAVISYRQSLLQDIQLLDIVEIEEISSSEHAKKFYDEEKRKIYQKQQEEKLNGKFL